MDTKQDIPRRKMKFNESILKHKMINFGATFCDKERPQKLQLAKELPLPIVDLGGSTLSVIDSTTATEILWQVKYGMYCKKCKITPPKSAKAAADTAPQ